MEKESKSTMSRRRFAKLSASTGVAVLGAGSANLHRLFHGGSAQEVICLARLWLDDRLATEHTAESNKGVNR